MMHKINVGLLLFCCHVLSTIPPYIGLLLSHRSPHYSHYEPYNYVELGDRPGRFIIRVLKGTKKHHNGYMGPKFSS